MLDIFKKSILLQIFELGKAECEFSKCPEKRSKGQKKEIWFYGTQHLSAQLPTEVEAR